MFNSVVKVKINKELYQHLEKVSARRGYASVDEMITHVLEQQITNEPSSEELVEARLRGLGYLG